MKNLLFLGLIILMYSCAEPVVNEVAPEFAQWRGDNRDGKYTDTNLMKSWPKEGLSLLWFNDSIGTGYGSPIVTSDRLYVMGAFDSTGYLMAFNLNGKMLWKSTYGKEFTESFEGSRCTPTLIGDLMYVCSGHGEITCFDTAGTKKWSKNMITDFNGKNIHFGYSESLLIDDSTLFATPGSNDTNVVALDRFTGTLKWISKGKSQLSAYCSPLLITLSNRKIMATFSANEFFGLDTKNGNLLWSHKQDTFCDIHGNTPFFENGSIYYAAGCGNGLVRLELSADGSKISEKWRTNKLINYISGVVKVNNVIYGACEDSKKWKSVDALTGNVIDSLDFNKGITIFADSMLYCYNEKGELGLIDPKANKLQLVSSFKIDKGTKEHFAHPVICHGVLYVRHGKSLLAYDLRKK